MKKIELFTGCRTKENNMCCEEIVKEITDFIVDYDKAIKVAMIVKDKNLISKCVKEWLEKEVN